MTEIWMTCSPCRTTSRRTSSPRCRSSWPVVQARAHTRHTDNIEAYQLYLRGRHVFFRRTPGAMAQSKLFFEQALAKDPRYTLALTGLADQ
jgi:hypothetical protein